MRFFRVTAIGCIFFSGCASPPARQAVVVVSTPTLNGLPMTPVAPPEGTRRAGLTRLEPAQFPDFTDDGDTVSLRAAVLQSRAYYHSLPADTLFRLSIDTYSAREMANSLDKFVELIDSAPTSGAWPEALKKDFWVYASAGADSKGTVTFSSYYEPTIDARLQQTGAYRYPIYGRPPDLIDVDLGLFNAAYAGARLSGRREGERLVPYFSREAIDSQRRLSGRALEIAWAKDPADIFFLQIEGSGWLRLADGKKVRIRYAGTNGLPYHSVGSYLIQSGRVPSKGFDHKEFVKYLQAHPKERQAVFNVDSRYVFFRVDTSTADVDTYGNLDVPLTPRRSIATDPKVFPKGALAWIDVVHAPNHLHVQRFMLNQDEGGAIQGPGRVDYFAGHGEEAEKFATHFWYPGKLYFIVRKRS